MDSVIFVIQVEDMLWERSGHPPLQQVLQFLLQTNELLQILSSVRLHCQQARWESLTAIALQK